MAYRDTIADDTPRYSDVELRLKLLNSGVGSLKDATYKDFVEFIPPNLPLAWRLYDAKEELKEEDASITSQEIIRRAIKKYEMVLEKA